MSNLMKTLTIGSGTYEVCDANAREALNTTKAELTEQIKKAAPRNLLVNSDFSNPVMSAGLNGYYGINKYVVDRWISWSEDAIQGNGYIVTQSPIDQNIDPEVIDLSKIYTVAIGLADGSVIYHCGKVTATNGIGIYANVYFGFRESGTPFVRIGGGQNVAWVALYEGEYNLETLPKYQPKGYETELLICRQYYGDTYIGLKFGQPRNLLDNSDFRNPVNQRGKDVYTSDGYCIDRWVVAAYGGSYDLIIGDGYVQPCNMSDYVRIYQQLEDSSRYSGKTVTCAINIDGVVYCQPFTFGNYGDWIIEDEVKMHSVSYLDFVLDFNVAKKVYWVALYEGEYTLNTMPEYQPKGYDAELAACKRYYRAIKGDPTLSGYIGSDCTTIYTLYPERADMRAGTSITVTVPDVIDVICGGIYYKATVVSSICDHTIFYLKVQYQADIPPTKSPCMIYAYGGIYLSSDIL